MYLFPAPFSISSVSKALHCSQLTAILICVGAARQLIHLKFAAVSCWCVWTKFEVEHHVVSSEKSCATRCCCCFITVKV